MQEPLLPGSGRRRNGAPQGIGHDDANLITSAGKIVDQLSEDMVTLEAIAARMTSEARGRASANGACGPMSPTTACQVGALTQRVRTGEDDPLRRAKTLIRSGHCSGYNFIFSVPLPSACTDADSRSFEKKHLRSHHTYEELIRHAIISPSCQKAAAIDGTCSSLPQARQCVIDLFTSFFDSLSSSLHSGIEVFKFVSEDCEELFLCVKMKDNLAEALAEMGEYSVQLSPTCLEKLHIKITDQTNLVPAFVNFEPHVLEDQLMMVYEKPNEPGAHTALRTIDSMRLLYDKVTDYIDLHELERMGLVSNIYLGHNREQLLWFVENWACFYKILWPEQPIDEIRDYFGEGVAFYFLFLGFMAKGLLAWLPVSLACSIGWLYGYDDFAQFFFCFFIIIWATILLKLWRRTEAHYANLWGMDYRDVKIRVKDPVNPNFHGTKKPSPLDENKLELLASPTSRLMGRTISVVVTVLVLFLVIACVGLNQYTAGKWSGRGKTFDVHMFGRTVQLSAGTIGAVILSLQIQFWDKLWSYVIVDRLNDLEQHVSQYAYDQARVAKTFAFKFINTFYAFFYIAYVQQFLNPAGCAGDCKTYLVKQLAIVFTTYISLGVVDMGLPYAKMKCKLWWEDRETRKHGHDVFKLSLLEQQAKMSEYTGQTEDADYLSSLFPVAFVMLFGTMMPASVLLAFFALSSQIRTHAWKLSKVSRRPFPVRTSSIGIWDAILNGLTYVSVFNTIGLMVTQVNDVCAYIPHFWRLTEALGIPANGKAAKLIAFFFLQNVAIIFKMIVDNRMSDVTSQTELERLRQEVQRVRLSERGNREIHEDINLRCSVDFEKAAWDQVPPLRPGHPIYVEPLI